jgi:hypothetical protein
MSILFAASEPEGMTLTGSERYARTDVDTNFTQHGTAFALGASGRIDFTAQTSGWAHMVVMLPTLSANCTQPICEFIDSGTGQVVFQLDMDGVSGTQGQTNLKYWNGAALTEILTTDYGLFAGILYTFDFHWVIDNSVGMFEWYIDGVLIAQLSGDTLHTGFTQIDRLNLRYMSTSGTGTGNAITFSEVIVATDDTRAMRVHAADPTGNGGQTAWTGDSTAVDDNGVDDTDFIESGVANDVETVAVRDLSAVADNLTPKAVVVSARALRDATGPQNMELVIRQAATDYLSGNVTGLTTAFAPFYYVWATDPNTAAAWTVSGINSMEVGVKAKT